MYKLLLLIICFVTSTSLFSQKIKEKDVPPKVIAALEKHFPNSKKATWEMAEEKYNTTFEVYGQKGSASFTDKGRILNSEMQITKDDLPFSIGYYIKKNHDNDKIQIASKLKDTSGAISYHIVIPDFMLTFNAAGEFVNEVSTTTEEVTEEQTETPTQN